ncbi:MAG: P-II family nitrogen regulator [Candidatus Eisenbacteria bacterium]
MKKVEAYIKAHRLDAVIGKLHEIDGLTGVSSHGIEGFGRGWGTKETGHITDSTDHWIPHVKLEIVCLDEVAPEVVGAIVEGAHTGLRGDGKIYVSPVEDAIRISTGERGKPAC